MFTKAEDITNSSIPTDILDGLGWKKYPVIETIEQNIRLNAEYHHGVATKIVQNRKAFENSEEDKHRNYLKIKGLERIASLSIPFVENNKPISAKPTNPRNTLKAKLSQIVLNHQLTQEFDMKAFVTHLNYRGYIDGLTITKIFLQNNKVRNKDDIDIIVNSIKNKTTGQETKPLDNTFNIRVIDPLYAVTKTTSPTSSELSYLCECNIVSKSALKNNVEYFNIDNLDLQDTFDSGTEYRDFFKHINNNTNFQFNHHHSESTDTIKIYELWAYEDIFDIGVDIPIIMTWCQDKIISLKINDYPDGKIPYIVSPSSITENGLASTTDSELLEQDIVVDQVTTRYIKDQFNISSNMPLLFPSGMISPQSAVLQGNSSPKDNEEYDIGQGNLQQIGKPPVHVEGIQLASSIKEDSLNSIREHLNDKDEPNKSIGDPLRKIPNLDRTSSGTQNSDKFLIQLKNVEYIISQIAKKLLHLNRQIITKDKFINITAYEFDEIAEYLEPEQVGEDGIPIEKDTSRYSSQSINYAKLYPENVLITNYEDVFEDFPISVSVKSPSQIRQSISNLSFILQTSAQTLEPTVRDALLSEIIKHDNPEILPIINKPREPVQDPLVTELAEIDKNTQQAELEKIRLENELLAQELLNARAGFSDKLDGSDLSSSSPDLLGEDPLSSQLSSQSSSQSTQNQQLTQDPSSNETTSLLDSLVNQVEELTRIVEDQQRQLDEAEAQNSIEDDTSDDPPQQIPRQINTEAEDIDDILDL